MMSDASGSRPVPDVSIAIVSWNTCALTLACLRAIPSASNGLVCDTWVVDNASSDDSNESIRREHPEVHLIANRSNVGYAGGMNQAIAASPGRYVLILNSDTAPSPDSITALVRCADANPRAGIVGPMLLNPDGSFQASFGDFPTLWNEFLSISGLGPRLVFRRYPSYAPNKSRVTRSVDYIVGACMLVRREAVAGVGNFDEEYFMYSEEIDWCFRMRRAGWEVWYCAGATIVHHGGQSTRQIRELMFRALYRSKVRFFQKYYGTAAAVALATLFVAASRCRRLITPLARLTPNPALRWRDLRGRAQNGPRPQH